MTNHKTTNQTIKNIADKIAAEFNPAKIILFGSYEWGAPNEDSDIDLFIIKETVDRRIDRERAVRKIIFGIETPLDILVYTPDEISRRLAFEDPFISEILTKGKTLYEAK
jgi:predicted nucleotidyltransferase